MLRVIFGFVNAHISSEAEAMPAYLVDLSSAMINIIDAISRDSLVEWLNRKEGGAMIKRILDKLSLQNDSTLVMQTSAILAHLIQKCNSSAGLLGLIASDICERAIESLKSDNPSLELMQAFQSMCPFIGSEDPTISEALTLVLRYATCPDRALET